MSRYWTDGRIGRDKPRLAHKTTYYVA